VVSRDSVGGPAPGAVEASIKAAREDVAIDSDSLEARRETLSAAAARLQREVDQYV